jgi:hypothetical protein
MGLLDDAIREHLDLKRQRGADPGEVERLEREALGPVRREPTGASLGAVPHLEVNADPEEDFEPATELYQEPAPAQAPKRGFLRRHRARATPQPGPADFTGHPDGGIHSDLGQAPGDGFDHPDPFGQDAFDHDDPFPDDQRLAPEEPATHEPADPPAAAAAPAPVEPPAGGPSPHLIFDSAPPPRPSFAPVPPGIPAPEPEPAPADAAELEPGPDQPPAPVKAPPAASESTPAEPPLDTEPASDESARAEAASKTREWSVEEAFAEPEGEPGEPTPAPAEEDVLEETPEFLQDTPDHDRLWFEQRPPRDFDFDG